MALGQGVPAISKPVRLAVWGLGRHACAKVLPAIVACPSTELVGVTTRDGEVARQEAAKLGCRVWPSADEMLGTEDLDAVYLATPIGLHASQGTKVLAAGKHLWCEKSLTSSSEESLQLIELSRRKKLCIAETFMYLYHPQFARVAELAIERRELGGLLSITSRFTMPLMERPGFRHTRELGGGALLDVACYPLSFALQLMRREPRVLVRTSRSAPEFAVDLSGHALLEFSPGIVAYLEWGYGRAYLNETMIAGEHGSLYADRIFSKVDGWNASIELRDARGTKTTEQLPATNAFVCMLEQFARAVNNEDLQERLRCEAALQARSLALLAASG